MFISAPLIAHVISLQSHMTLHTSNNSGWVGNVQSWISISRRHHHCFVSFFVLVLEYSQQRSTVPKELSHCSLGTTCVLTDQTKQARVCVCAGWLGAGLADGLGPVWLVDWLWAWLTGLAWCVCVSARVRMSAVRRRREKRVISCEPSRRSRLEAITKPIPDFHRPCSATGWSH